MIEIPVEKVLDRFKITGLGTVLVVSQKELPGVIYAGDLFRVGDTTWKLISVEMTRKNGIAQDVIGLAAREV